MFKKTTLTIVTIALLFTGCSSYPDSAEGVSKAVCSELKSGNFDQLAQYVVPEQKESFNKTFAKAKVFLASDMAKKMFANMNCDKADKTKSYDNGKQKFYYGQMKIKVKQFDKTWYFVQ